MIFRWDDFYSSMTQIKITKQQYQWRWDREIEREMINCEMLLVTVFRFSDQIHSFKWMSWSVRNGEKSSAQPSCNAAKTKSL